MSWTSSVLPVLIFMSGFTLRILPLCSFYCEVEVCVTLLATHSKLNNQPDTSRILPKQEISCALAAVTVVIDTRMVACVFPQQTNHSEENRLDCLQGFDSAFLWQESKRVNFWENSKFYNFKHLVFLVTGESSRIHTQIGYVSLCST